MSPLTRGSPHRASAALILLSAIAIVAYSGCPHVADRRRHTEPVAALSAAAHPAPVSSRTRPAPPPPAAPPAERFHVLMINGGLNPSNNSQSHLLHVQALLDLLRSADAKVEQITIFTSDGEDPAADLATREVDDTPGLWRVSGTTLENRLKAPVMFVNSEVPGMPLHAAKKEGIGQWFDEAKDRLGPGDTLLLYVTDHGTKNAKDLTNNFISLWGEKLSVRELREMIARLDPGVRVVALMSQCYSGAFAHLMDAHRTGDLPSGSVCGYFSSTHDRLAYGCYPENLGRNNVGHSFHFIQSLAFDPSFPDAHTRVLVTDSTPDVPLRTTDVFLRQILDRAAAEREESLTELVDTLLEEAWRDKAAWEPEIRLLDRIGTAYGCFSPRSLKELDTLATRLPDISTQFDTVSRAWRGTLGDANQAMVDRFLKGEPGWRERLDELDAMRQVTPESGRSLTPALLAALTAFTEQDRHRAERLQLLNDKGKAAKAAAYRMEVRLAVVLRMRTILTSIAGRVYIATRGTPEQREAYAALARCESLALPGTPHGETLLADTEPFPPFEEDVAKAQAALPSWMGIQFREVAAERRERMALQEGAAAVINVYPDTPAQRSGLTVGDIVTGPPGQPFTHRGQIREWTMLAATGKAHTLEVMREHQPLTISLAPEPFPMKWPELPGPPKLSSAAPPIPKLTAYRGTLPAALADGRPHLLFFWATWCAPCKASLPELVAFEKERATPVIAITDEPAGHLDKFFTALTDPFPETVAVDEFRSAFVAYGVSATPTYVLVDGDGVVRSYSTGYNAAKGLDLGGWTWAGRPAAAAE